MHALLVKKTMEEKIIKGSQVSTDVSVPMMVHISTMGVACGYLELSEDGL
jgi:hypothetical protein